MSIYTKLQKDSKELNIREYHILYNCSKEREFREVMEKIRKELREREICAFLQPEQIIAGGTKMADGSVFPIIKRKDSVGESEVYLINGGTVIYMYEIGIHVAHETEEGLEKLIKQFGLENFKEI